MKPRIVWVFLPGVQRGRRGQAIYPGSHVHMCTRAIYATSLRLRFPHLQNGEGDSASLIGFNEEK